MDQESINEIEGNADNLPQEVKDFIFGDGYEKVSKELSSLVINENEKIDLPNEIILFVIGIKTSDDLISYVSALTTTQENKEVIKKIIDEKVINELLLTIEVSEEIDNEKRGDILVIPKPPAPIALTALTDRLKQSSIVGPVKHGYDAETSKTSVSPIIEKPIPSIDPYHEAIQ